MFKSWFVTTYILILFLSGNSYRSSDDTDPTIHLLIHVFQLSLMLRFKKVSAQVEIYRASVRVVRVRNTRRFAFRVILMRLMFDRANHAQQMSQVKFEGNVFSGFFMAPSFCIGRVRCFTTPITYLIGTRQANFFFYNSCRAITALLVDIKRSYVSRLCSQK